MLLPGRHLLLSQAAVYPLRGVYVPVSAGCCDSRVSLHGPRHPFLLSTTLGEELLGQRGLRVSLSWKLPHGWGVVRVQSVLFPSLPTRTLEEALGECF